MPIGSRSRPSLILRVSIFAAGMFLVAAGIIAAVNMLLLPRLSSRVERLAAERWGGRLDISRAVYIPFRGLVLRDLTISGTRIRVTVSRIRITVPARAVRLLRYGPELEIPEIDPWNAQAALWMLLESAGRAGMIPRLIVMDDVAATVPDFSADRFVIERFRIKNDGSKGSISLYGSGSSSPPLAVGLTIDYGERFLAGYVEAGDFSPIGSHIGKGVFAGSISVRTAEGERVSLNGEIGVGGLELDLPAAADAPIGGIDIRYSFKAVYDPNAAPGSAGPQCPVFSPPDYPRGELIFNSGEIEINGIRAEVLPSIKGIYAARTNGNGSGTGWMVNPSSLHAVIRLPETPVQHIMESIPEAVSGPLSRLVMNGSLKWDLELTVPLDDISEMTWKADTGLKDFAVLEIDPSVNVFKINDGFVHTIVDETVGYRRAVRIPPARPASVDWMLTHSEHTLRQILRIRADDLGIAAGRPPVLETPADGSPAAKAPPDPAYRYIYVDDMSPWVIRAVLTAEDGDFFFYGGVNWVTLADAIERNIREGEILFGASTISMQLVKMLFLDQQRIFSRKLQEVFLVYLMEHQVPVWKERILELYLNLAEFGPGVYGIYDAAVHYFGKGPGELSAGEAAWLASILPSPKNYHRYFENRWISDGWFARMIGLYDIMLERGRMTSEEYADAISERPVFTP